MPFCGQIETRHVQVYYGRNLNFTSIVWTTVVRFPLGADIFLFVTASLPVLGLTWSLSNGYPGLFLESKSVRM